MAKIDVASQPMRSGTGTLDSNGLIREIRTTAVADREHVGGDLVPLLNHESLCFEKRTDLRALPADDVLKNRNQHSESVLTENGSFCDWREVLIFGDCDREAISAVDM